MAFVLSFPSTRVTVPRPDGFVPGAGEEGIVLRGESEGGQGSGRIGGAAVEVGRFASLGRVAWCQYGSYDSYFSIGSLTYIKHQPPCRPSTFSHVDCSSILWISNQSEDFGGKTDGVAVLVLGFKGFAAGFGYGMAAT